MRMRRQAIATDIAGATAVELAMCLPLLLMMIIGVLQLATMFFANAGLQQAVESGARYATIYPSPTDSQIVAKVNASRYGLDSSRVTGPSITHGTSNGVKYIDLSMSYAVPLNFVFFQTGSLTLSHSRRTYQP
jgi:Flp pilus assembly protein TadG